MSMPSQSFNRIRMLDGVRALAIFWVALYHYGVFWSSAGRGDALLPYDDMLSWIPMAHVGYLGVSMFFIVSGFVISLSLERSRSVVDFAQRRAIRLWPALLICGTITMLLTSTFGPPELMRSPLEYLISLTFVPPGYVGRVLGTEMAWLDGAYWSLWTEVRFYAIAALLYFATKGRLLAAWCLFAGLSAAVHLAGAAGVGPAEAISRLLFGYYQPFFTAGIALATLYAAPGRLAGKLLFVLALLQALLYQTLREPSVDPAALIGLLIVFALPALATLSRRRLPVLSNRAIILIGQASYGYYLLHQNAGLALLGLADGWPDAATVALMLAIQAALIGVAIGLYRTVEVPLGRALNARLRRRLQAGT